MMRSDKNTFGFIVPLLFVAACAADQQVEDAQVIAQETKSAPSELEVAPERWADLKAEIRETFPDVAQLSTDELKDWIASEGEAPLLLDVREANEFDVSHLEHAVLATDEDAALRVLGDSSADRRVVLYCSVGYRSSALAQSLKNRGYTNVFNLEGSIFEWANRGENIYANNKMVQFVHPYDSDWGRLLRREYWSDLDGSK